MKVSETQSVQYARRGHSRGYETRRRTSARNWPSIWLQPVPPSSRQSLFALATPPRRPISLRSSVAATASQTAAASWLHYQQAFRLLGHVPSLTASGAWLKRLADRVMRPVRARERSPSRKNGGTVRNPRTGRPGLPKESCGNFDLADQCAQVTKPVKSASFSGLLLMTANS